MKFHLVKIGNSYTIVCIIWWIFKLYPYHHICHDYHPLFNNFKRLRPIPHYTNKDEAIRALQRTRERYHKQPEIIYDDYYGNKFDERHQLVLQLIRCETEEEEKPLLEKLRAL